MPFLIFAGLSGYFYWLIRRARIKPPVPDNSNVSAASPFLADREPAEESLDLVEI